MAETTFLQTPYTQAYEQYYRQAVEQPLMRYRERALQDLLTRQAQAGVLRSGVGMYPVMDIERQLADVLGREGARLALQQAQRQTQLEEAERTRQFQREMLERQIDIQRQILNEQRRLAEQQMWGQLAGMVLGSLISPALGLVGTGLAQTIGGVLAPQTLARQRALENLLMQYYQNLLSPQMTMPMTTTAVSIPAPITAGVEYVPQYIPPTTTGSLYQSELNIPPYILGLVSGGLPTSPLSLYYQPQGLLIPANQLFK